MNFTKRKSLFHGCGRVSVMPMCGIRDDRTTIGNSDDSGDDRLLFSDTNKLNANVRFQGQTGVRYECVREWVCDHHENQKTVKTRRSTFVPAIQVFFVQESCPFWWWWTRFLAIGSGCCIRFCLSRRELYLRNITFSRFTDSYFKRIYLFHYFISSNERKHRYIYI